MEKNWQLRFFGEAVFFYRFFEVGADLSFDGAPFGFAQGL